VSGSKGLSEVELDQRSAEGFSSRLLGAQEELAKFTTTKGFISAFLDIEEHRGFDRSKEIGGTAQIAQRTTAYVKGFCDQRRRTSEGQRQKRKILKTKGNLGSLVLGEDVGLSQVIQMENQTLVGRASGRTFSLKTMIDWVHFAWKEHLGYVPEIIELNRNWFAFNFLQPDHAKWVLGKLWSVNNSPLLRPQQL
jgi:hypothetical protein